VAEIADRLRFVGGDASLQPDEASLARELLLHLGRIERERGGDAWRVLADRRELKRRAFDPLQHLHDVDADARYLDARGERGAVPIVDRAALRLDVEAPLPLVLGGLF